MANVLIEESSLTNIANAIRAKNGLSTTYRVTEMPSAISAISGGGGGGGVDIPTFTITPGTPLVVTCDKTYNEVENLFFGGESTARVTFDGEAYFPACVYDYSDELVYAAYEEGIPFGDIHYASNGTITFVTPSSLPSGGSGSAPKKQINFIDYDGTIVDSYTKTEWQSVSALPSNPSHSGLVAQGWNWTKAQIDAQLTAAPDGDIWVGQMYITTSGDTEIDVSMQEGRLDPILDIYVNGSVTVDWGDNTASDTVTGTSLTTRKDVSHTYAAAGDYMIKIHVVSGKFQFSGGTSYALLRKNTTGNQNKVYANCVQAVRFGSGITSIGTYAFYNCYSLASVTIPSSVTSIGTYAFSYCYSLASVIIPSGVTSIGTYAFSYCYSLASVTIPSSITSIGTYAFYYCYSLASAMIPSSVKSISNTTFYNCYSLASVTIPSGVTSIGTNTFFTCCSLASVTIPSSVTSISNNAFSNCYGVAEYHIKPTTPPTLGTSVFSNIVSDCKIYVPTASLSTYQAATNWSTYASYMVGE